MAFLAASLPQETDAAPRENCEQQEKPSQNNHKPRRDILASPIRIDGLSSQELTVSVHSCEESDDRKWKPFLPSKVLALRYSHLILPRHASYLK